MGAKKIILFFLLAFGYCFSQEDDVIETLKEKVKSHKTIDSVKVELMLDLAWEYSFYDYRNSIDLCDQSIKNSTDIGYENGLATALSIKGNNYRALNKYDSAYFFLNRSLDIRKKQGRKNKIAAVTQNMANVFYQENKYADAISLYKEAVGLSEEALDPKATLVALTNLASAYRVVGLTQKAHETLNKAFKINKVLKDEIQEQFLYTTLGTLQQDLGNSREAIKYGLMALKLSKKKKDLQNEAAVENNLGLYYKYVGDFKMSFYHYQESIKLYSQLEDSLSLATVYNNTANAYSEDKQHKKCIEEASRALAIAKNYSDTTLIYKCMLTLANGYSHAKDFSKALFYMELAMPLVLRNGSKTDLSDMYKEFAETYILMSNYKMATEYMIKVLAYADSIKSDENNQLVANLGVEMELNSKENEIELLNKTSELQTLELDRQKTVQWFFVGVSFLFACIVIIIFLSYKRIKKANLVIENQKLQVELKNEEITHQKELVDEKQKEIIDSINYAKRIQQAVLTGEDVWNKISKEHFILFKPKDIVSGDFYWAYNTPNNRSVFALADCTGHGVPGGFMSMLGNSFLNEIVVENKMFKADQILNKLRLKIIHALEQKGGTQQKDGMDISLCVWNKLDNTLEFSGANNPLWLVRTGVDSSGSENKQLQEFKADKMPIGLYLEEEKPFTSVTIQLQKGDIVYLFTDGYADQFGGPKGKKLKYKPLIESLIKNCDQDMASQKASLENDFSEWMSTYEQVDDVSLIGVKVS
jgi:serine phosphatase RsbU (regulator of sigma subunit)